MFYLQLLLLEKVHLYFRYHVSKYICILDIMFRSTFVFQISCFEVHLYFRYHVSKYICILCIFVRSNFVLWTLIYQVKFTNTIFEVNMQSRFVEQEPAHSSGAPEFTFRFQWFSCCSIFNFGCSDLQIIASPFVLFIFSPLYYLSFD